MAFVVLDGDGNIVSLFATAQTNPPDGYAEIADDDARIAAFNAKQAATIATPTVQIISTGTPAISGTYAIAANNQQQITSVATYIAVNGKFPAGLSQLPWPDSSGTPHTFPSTALFQEFASAIADYVTAAALGSPPSQPITIP